jgi:phosphomannomutase
MSGDPGPENPPSPPPVPKTPLQKPEDYQRFCPGEEKIHLSDAICFGRRRSNYPKCVGCQFNDDERKDRQASVPVPVPRAAVEAGQADRGRVEAIFRDCDVLGACPDPLSPDMAWRIGLAAAQFLKSELRGYDRSQTDKSTVVVGMDMRQESPELEASLIDGLRCGGSPVIDIGMIDTPQLFFAVNRLGCCGGVQVTGGSSPAHYNGFKFCGQKGRPINSETGLIKISKIVINSVRHAMPQLPELRRQDLAGPYKEYVRGFLKHPGAGVNTEQPLSLVADASNGMAGRWLPIIFEEVDWLDIAELNFEHNGEFAHEPDPLVEDHLKPLQERVLRGKADLGICFDGDADCCIFVDNKGQAIRADLLSALLARHLLKASPGATVIYDLRSSRALPEEIRKAGGLPRRERGIQSFIKKAVFDAKGLFASELGGRYYFRDNFYCESSLVTLACVINILTDTGRPLDELIAPFRRYARSGERRFRMDGKTDAISLLSERYANGSINYLDGITVIFEDWWFNARPSADRAFLELNVEAINDAMLRAKLAELSQVLGGPMELGA